MVLDLRAPYDASLGALREAAPVFASYVLSFIHVAIYWNNHHHLFYLVRASAEASCGPTSTFYFGSR